jgi:excisionase family DNA binding protein
MTGEQVIRRLKRHPDVVYRWLRSGELKGMKVGRTWLVSEAELVRFRKDPPERRKRK